MSNGNFSVNEAFTLKWVVQYSDVADSYGQIVFAPLGIELVGDEADQVLSDDSIRVISASADWATILPIFINEMVLEDEPMSDAGVVECPAYESAAFTMTGPDGLPVEAHIWWSLRGCGFGQYHLRCAGGFPHLSNECMSKRTIQMVFNQIQLPA